MRLFFRYPAICSTLSLLLAGCGHGAVTEPPEEPFRVHDVGLSIDQPPEVLPVGFQVELRVFVIRSDGTRVQWVAQWSTDREDMVQIITKGPQAVVRAVGGEGPVTVSVALGDLTASVQFRVTPLPGRLAFVEMAGPAARDPLIMVAAFDSSTSVAVTYGNELHPDFPAWSPDGTRLAVTCANPTSQQSFVCLVEDDGKLSPLVEADSSGPSWSADGTGLLLTRSGAIWSVALDGSAPDLITTPEDVNDIFSGVRAQPGGKLLAYAVEWGYGEGVSLCLGQPEDSGATCTRSEVYEPAWSQDGKSLVGRLEPGSSLIRFNLDSFPFHFLLPLDPGSIAYSPTLSPDGQWIAFTRSERLKPFNSLGIWAMRSDGTNLVQLSSGSTKARHPTWGR